MLIVRRMGAATLLARFEPALERVPGVEAIASGSPT